MSNQGLGVLKWEPPTLEIEGEKYELRRLGLLDIERLTHIVSKASKFVDRRVMGNIDKFDAKQAGSFLVDYLPYAFDEIVAFLATVIGLEPGVTEEVVEMKRKKAKKEFVDPNIGTIRDPSVFPLGSEVRLIGALVEHPDVVRFFTESKTLWSGAAMKRLRGRLSTESTESNTDTDGAPSTSSDED